MHRAKANKPQPYVVCCKDITKCANKSNTIEIYQFKKIKYLININSKDKKDKMF